MRSITIGSYQVSIILLAIILAAGILGSFAIALTYMWATRTIPYAVVEPLSITSFPSSLSTQPGENQTLSITIQNSANITYTVLLNFTLNDTQYQQTYVTFSNTTYTISPGLNSITAWCATTKNAPPTQLDITIEFYRE
jgi:hypothetical protein